MLSRNYFNQKVQVNTETKPFIDFPDRNVYVFFHVSPPTVDGLVWSSVTVTWLDGYITFLHNDGVTLGRDSE